MIKRRVRNMMYIVKGLQFTHKRHLKQLRRRITKEADSGPSEETVMDVIYDTFSIPTSLAAPEICRSKKKRKATDLITVHPKRRKYFFKNNTKCK